MSKLSNSTLSQANAFCPTYDREALGIGIVHLGPGAFHRAHQAVFTEGAIAKSGGNWGICAVSLNSSSVKDALAPQDGLYTLAITFPNTMVDSITPATNDGIRNDVEAAIGLKDSWPVQREAFAQWVIEDVLPSNRPDWEAAGATLTNDVHGFEVAKLRILNGAHSTLTYLGLLAGEVSVEDAINNPVLRGFVDTLIRHETLVMISSP